jgi:hypothetical protein
VTTSSTYNAQRVVHTQGYGDEHGYVNIVFNDIRFIDVTREPSFAPTTIPTVRPITTPTRRPTAGALSPSASPTQAPSRRPTQAPVTSSPTKPIMVPVIAPTPVPSISDDDYTTCSRENLKFFSGEAHDDCLNQLFGDVSSQIQSMSATMNYMMETFRRYIDINETSLIETVDDIVNHKLEILEQQSKHVDDKLNMLTGNVTILVDQFKDYLVETKYKEPTVSPTPAPTRHRRSRRPATSAEPI